MDCKANAIETIIKAIPMIAAGNSKNDFEMIESSKGLKMIVNPDDSEKVDKLRGLTLKEYAEKHDWIIVYANDDVPEEKRQPSL